MRSLLIHDHTYRSIYTLGVEGAMEYQEHDHLSVSIRQPIEALRATAMAVKPHILWTHMWLWGPHGSPRLEDILELSDELARAGTRIVLHDGDFKQATRHPHDISSWCSIALLNHTHDRSAWNVPTIRWPYFAQWQREIADPDPLWACEMFFAGNIGKAGIYSERTELLLALESAGVDIKYPAGVNTLEATPVVAASAGSVLGFGRQDASGWVDTRVFQYPGCGGILIHDDVGGYLTPGEHYMPYDSGSAASVLEALETLRAMSDEDKMALRLRAFEHVQRRHSSVARVREVLQILFPEISRGAGPA